jgi:hypothetical protein
LDFELHSFKNFKKLVKALIFWIGFMQKKKVASGKTWKSLEISSLPDN